MIHTHPSHRSTARFDEDYKSIEKRLWSRQSWRRLWEYLARRVPVDSSVLDVGCGRGEFSEAIRELRGGNRYVGIDQSEKAIEDAKAAIPGNPMPYEISYVHGDAIRMLENSSGYDVVVLCRVLEFVEDDLALLRACKAAAPRVLIAVPNHQSGDDHRIWFDEAGDVHDRYRPLLTDMSFECFRHPADRGATWWWMGEALFRD